MRNPPTLHNRERTRLTSTHPGKQISENPHENRKSQIDYTQHCVLKNRVIVSHDQMIHSFDKPHAIVNYPTRHRTRRAANLDALRHVICRLIKAGCGRGKWLTKWPIDKTATGQAIGQVSLPNSLAISSHLISSHLMTQSRAVLRRRLFGSDARMIGQCVIGFRKCVN